MDLFGDIDPPAPPELMDEPDEEGIDQTFSAPVPTHPRTQNTLFGHNKAEQTLLKHFLGRRLAHGLVLAGPKGIGKSTLAFRFARFLLKQGVQDPNQNSLFGEASAPQSLNIGPDDPVSRLVASGAHPDLLYIEREYDEDKGKYKDSVGVNMARKVNPFLRMTASSGGWRIVIIDDADTMNRNAQNALLKILEEPPGNTLLILVTHRLGTLIPTIRSRAQVLSLLPLEMEDFTEVMRQQGCALETEALASLYLLAEGSPGHALDYVARESLETLSQIIELLQDCPSWSWPQIHHFAEQMGQAGRMQAYEVFAELLPWVFRQLIRIKARGQNALPQSLGLQGLQDLHRHSSLESLLKICENLQNHFDTARYGNLDKRQTTITAFSIIAA